MTRKTSKPTGRRATVRVKTARGRTVSSQRWLQRQLNDPYVAEAKKRGYRSRAAFKLLQLDDQIRFLKPGGRIVDLGAAPGGWTQVAVERVRPQQTGGVVVGIDLTPIEPIPGATVLAKDFYDEDAPALQRKVVIFNRGGPGGVGGGGGVSSATNGRSGRAGPLPRGTPASARRLFSDELAHGVPIRVHGPTASQSI